FTYAELDERTNRLARALLAAGAGPGARVAYLDRTAHEAVELLLAAAKVGAVAVPLNWRLAQPELLSVLRDSGAPLLIAGPTYAETARVDRRAGGDGTRHGRRERRERLRGV